MIGIQGVSAFVPAERVSNIALIEKFSIEKEFLRDKIGVLERTVMALESDTSDLAAAALAALLTQQNLDPDSIDALVVVTQNPDNNIPHVAGMVHGQAGLRETCAAFDISLGCSGYVYGLSILRSFMRDNGMHRGVLITADPYSKIIDPEDRNSALLFGDAATATLLSDTPHWSLGPFTFGSRGVDCDAIRTENGKFIMDGRAVFNFAATTVPKDLRLLLQIAEVSEIDVDMFVLHQGSKFIVKTISDRMSVPFEKFFSNIENTGNTVSSSIPLALSDIIHHAELRTIALSGFGVGLSWASCLMRRME